MRALLFLAAVLVVSTSAAAPVELVWLLAQQPFRIDGDRAFGLGIADDKQGIALILHTLAMLKAMDARD